MPNITIYNYDVIEGLLLLPDESVDCVVTSPPYWGLRDYGVSGQVGLEKTVEEYVEKMVEVFQGVKRVLKKSGTLWLNLGDKYNNSSNSGGSTPCANSATYRIKGILTGRVGNLKPKDLIGLPWRVAFALQADGWYLRQDIIWNKPNVMPESTRDRCTKSHEYIFLLTKSSKYFYNQDAIAEPLNYPARYERRFVNPDNANRKWKRDKRLNALSHELLEQRRLEKLEKGTRNKRSVWKIPTMPYLGAHFAVFPIELPDTCIKAGCPRAVWY